MNKPKFKVGQKLRIKEDLKLYNNKTFVHGVPPGMMKMAGKIVTIRPNARRYT